LSLFKKGRRVESSYIHASRARDLIRAVTHFLALYSRLELWLACHEELRHRPELKLAFLSFSLVELSQLQHEEGIWFVLKCVFPSFAFAMSSFDYAQTAFMSREQIRLLTLLPATPLSSEDSNEKAISIHTSLRAVNWADKPPYIAVSYMWGDPTILEKILVNNQTFEITVNLHEALCNLQTHGPVHQTHGPVHQTHGPVHLWVDAICINQNDDVEKSDQVRKMTEIYKAATSVFAWLGPSANDSNAAMDSIERIAEGAIKAGQLNLSREVMFKIWDPDPEGLLNSVRQPFQNLSESIGLDFPQVAIKLLSERGYWSRTWIAQEFSVASTIVVACGSKRLDFLQICAAFLFLPLHRAFTSKRLGLASLDVYSYNPEEERWKVAKNFIQNVETGAPCRLIGFRNRYQKRAVNNYHSPLMDLLGSVSPTAQATDPRDRIYGLLGLAADTAELGIEADYAKKVHQVFTDTAKAMVRNGFTDVLSWCRFSNGQSDLPSWVPDFSVTLLEPISSYKCRAPPWKPLFSASGTTKVKVSTESYAENPRFLYILGLTVDTIEEVGAPWKAEDDYKTSVNLLFEQIAEFWDRAQNLPHPVSTDPDFWSEALWRVPCADQQWHEYSRRRAHIGAEAGVWEILARNRGDLSGYADEAKQTAWRRYYLAMEVLYNFRPFISKKGYIGIAPEFASPGDMICIIFGAIAPYVLRRHSEKRFELVGETYVHGIMDGEAMEMGLEEEEFCLL
jgi:hypothetical protein